MIPSKYLLYTLICSLFFIASCYGQNEKNIRECNIAFTSQNDSPDQSYIYPNLPDSASKIGEYIREIHQDKNGNLWFGTLERGVARYNLSADKAAGKALIYFTTEDGLVDNQINGIVEDSKGNIWFATTGGVSKYDGKTFTNFTTENGLNDNQTWSILSDSKDNIWVGTLKGVSRYDGTSFSNFSLPKAAIENPTYRFSTDLAWDIIEDSKGNFWFGTDGVGVVKYDPSADRAGGKGFTHFTKEDGLNTNDVTSILEDSKGNFWFGSRETRVLEEGKKYSYVNSGDGGLSRYDGKTFTQFPDIEALIAKDVGALYEDETGIIWFASKHHGLYRYDLSADKAGGKSFSNYMDQSGIAGFNCVQSILKDDKGNMWVGFSGGLFRLEGESLNHISVDGPW